MSEPRHTIRIAIRGAPRSGKSKAAELIAAALHAAGWAVDVHDHGSRYTKPDCMTDRLASISVKRDKVVDL